jgi:hypothetical protein
MKTRIVHTKIWQDDWFYNLSANAQRLFLYCITNQHIGLAGIYELSDRIIRFDLKLAPDELSDLKTELGKKVMFFDGWIYVVNSSRYCNYSGEKNELATKRELLKVPESIRRYIIDTVSSTIDTSINHKSKTINHKSEIINQESETINKGMELLRQTLTSKGVKV